MISLEEVARIMIDAHEQGKPERWLTEAEIYRDLFEAKVRVMTDNEKDEYVGNTNLILEEISAHLDTWTKPNSNDKTERYAMERVRDLSEEELSKRKGRVELFEYRLTEYGCNALKAECAKDDVLIKAPDITDITLADGLPDITNPLQ